MNLPATEKEILLKEELSNLVKELDESRGRILELKLENDWLQEEANKIRLENREYTTYMEKKTSKRQMAVVSLSDYNQKQIDDMQNEEKNMTEQFEKRKEELNADLLEKESVLAKINQELENLSEFKVLRQQQQSRIQDLERELMALRGRHTETIQQLKKAFLQEKHDCQTNADRKISQMSKQANQEAITCLNVHSQRIRAENRSLRHELLALIRKSQALREHERQLLEQRRALRSEREYADDLGRLRAERRMRAADPGICAAAAAFAGDDVPDIPPADCPDNDAD